MFCLPYRVRHSKASRKAPGRTQRRRTAAAVRRLVPDRM